MWKSLSIFTAICLIASSALGADSVEKINETYDLGDLADEQKWYPVPIVKSPEEIRDGRKKNIKSKWTTNLWESDRISFPLTLKLNNLGIPKVRMAFRVTF